MRDVASVVIAVQQHSCSDQSKVSAGSSLRLSTVDGGDCRLKRIVEQEYTFICHFNISATPEQPPLAAPKKKPTSVGCNALCNVTFTAILDYEGFGAFEEVSSQQQGMNTVVLRKSMDRIPLSHGKEDDGERMYTHSPSCCPLQRYDSTEAAVREHLQSKTVQGAAMLDLSNADQVRARFKQYASVYFIGTSHMRYLWDAVAVQYFNGTAILEQLPQHHRDEAAANTWFINNYFTMELPSLIQEVCAKYSLYAPNNAQPSDKPIAFIIQAGSWDLDYNPVRNLVSYPNSSTAVLELIRKLATAGNTCHGHPTQVMWVTSPPMPECDTSPGAPAPPTSTSSKGVRYAEKSSCFDKGYRNNYAIAAANQHFVQAIIAAPAGTDTDKTKANTRGGSTFSQLWDFLGMGGKRKDNLNASKHTGGSGEVILHDETNPLLTVLDAYGIVFPDRQQHVCGLHYLCCKHTPKVNTVDMLYTPGGSRLLEALLTVLLA
jgi:hypothetical protein